MSRLRPFAVCCVSLAICLGLLGCPRNDRGVVYFAGTNEDATSVVASPGGGHFVLSNYGRVMKFSDSGELEWTQGGGVGRNVGVAVSDGGFVRVAGGYSATVVVRKWDSLGTAVWTREHTVAGANYLDADSVVATADGGCVASLSSLGEGKLFLLKLDGDGEVVWERRVESWSRGTWRSKLLAVGDDGFVLSADRGSFLALVRVNSQGEVRWSREYDCTGNWKPGGACAVLPDGGLMLVRSGQKRIATILRTDAEGNILWMVKNIGTLDTDLQGHDICDMLIDEQGRIILVGDAMSTSIVGTQITGQIQGFIMQLDSACRVNWTRTLGRLDQGQCINSVALTSSGDYITAGGSEGGLHIMHVRPDGSILQ